MTNPDLGWP
ncbi:unnamed protein product, partial [Rotaria socialis]